MNPLLGDQMRTPPALTSADLAMVTTVQGTATHLSDTVVSVIEGSTIPALTQRHYQLTIDHVLRGDATHAGQTVTFDGFTTLPAPFRSRDLQSPILSLDGQDFFERDLAGQSVQVVALIGGPPISPAMGFQGKSAFLTDVQGTTQPIRVLLAEGVNATLPQALQFLVGWRKGQSWPQTESLIAAGHPLIPLDALRIYVKQASSVQPMTALAQWLLHPSQPPELKELTLNTLTQLIRNLSPGAPETDELLDTVLMAWRLERQYAVESSYLHFWLAGATQVNAAANAEQIKAIATDETALDQLHALKEQLASRF